MKNLTLPCISEAVWITGKPVRPGHCFISLPARFLALSPWIFQSPASQPTRNSLLIESTRCLACFPDG